MVALSQYYFDNHAHRTEVETCKLDPVKVSVNPYYTIVGFSIDAGSKEFTVSQEVSIPLSDSSGEFDEGDYPFFISLTDREEWSVQKRLNIKILNIQNDNKTASRVIDYSN